MNPVGLVWLVKREHVISLLDMDPSIHRCKIFEFQLKDKKVTL